MRQGRIIVAILVLVTASGGFWVAARDGHFGPVMGSAGQTNQVRIGGPFNLVDHLGSPVSEATYHGRYTLVFFGYTYCPDVCPTTLGTISAALDILGDDAERIRPLFITVDPERDTPEYLRDYLAHFNPDIIGLTGTIEQIKSVARAYGVYYAKAQEDDADADDYLMDHTSLTFFMDEDGNYAAHFSHAADAQSMAHRMKQILSESG